MTAQTDRFAQIRSQTCAGFLAEARELLDAAERDAQDIDDLFTALKARYEAHVERHYDLVQAERRSRPLEALRPLLTPRSWNVLVGVGAAMLGDLADLTEAEFRQRAACGTRVAAAVQAALHQNGLCFRYY